MDALQQYGLIGYPLGHSFSKQYFTEKFERERLAHCRFDNFAIEQIQDFPAVLTANPALRGLGVTIPYKEKILPFIHELSPEVMAIGATNSIRVRNGRLTAFNTDIIGFEQSFSPLLQAHHRQALVLGNGGAAKAVQYVLQKLGIAFTTAGRGSAAQLHYEAITANLLADYTIIINCTPLGMQPNNDTFPLLPYEHITPQHYLYDLVYIPAETVFLQKGKAKGATVKNGYDMLLAQAEASWRLWNT